VVGAKAGAHAGLEKAEGAPAIFLGLVERHVGVPQKLIGGLAIGWRKRDADAGSDHDLLTFDIVRLAQERHDAFGQDARLRRSGEPRLQDREFVAAESSDHVGAAQARAETLRHRRQKLVAGGVAQGVVDVLEFIEIEIKNGEYFRVPAHAQQSFVEALVKQHPVWQTGQRIVMRHMGDACLGLALRGHIHDRDKLRGPVAEHGAAPISEDVDFRPIRLEMLPKVAGASVRTGPVSNRLLDCVPVALRHYVEQGQLQERPSVITVMNDRRVVHGHEFQGFGIEEPHRNRIVLEDQFERFFRLISLGLVPVCPDPADR